MKFKISERVLVSWSGLRGYQSEILEMLSQLVKEFLSCVLIMDPVIGCITKKQGRKVIILLAGGDKHSQAKDIKTALRLARNL
jgi:hypothetical protein